MRQTFNYTKFNEEKLDSMIESFSMLTEKSIEGKNDTKEYRELNNTLTNNFMKYCVESIPNAKFNSLDDIKNPMIHKNVFFLQTFNTILAQAITPAVPTVVASGYNELYDTTQVGYGDNARYYVESNEMFIVNDIAEGIARGGVQTAYNTEYTVQARRKQVSIYVDWYIVAAGKQDWGKLCQKIGLAFSAYIQGKVAKAMASAITDASKHGISGYIASGMTDDNWLTIARNVKLANGGADVYALGTNIALADVLPAESATSAFRYTDNSEIIKRGFLPSYKGVPMIELGNALVPNTINGTPEVVVPDNIIYFIPMGMNKPVCDLLLEEINNSNVA